MALANKDRTPNDSSMAIIQATAFYDHHNFNGLSLIHPPQEPESSEKISGLTKNFTMSNSSSVSSPSSTNSNGLGYQANLSEEGHSVITFKPDYANFVYGGETLLSFEHTKRAPEDSLVWDDHDLHNQGPLTATAATSHLPLEASGSHLAATGYGGSPSSGLQFAWLNDEEADNTIADHGINQDTSNSKRPSTGESKQALKKQCVGANNSKKAKSKPASVPSKDPQSVAAKSRRERISERLKILQELVPNGSKVDLVTMLEKAISYVKFLQLQVKVLATDDFWPAQGGKAPDLSQVREAIDAILASQRDQNSSSK